MHTEGNRLLQHSFTSTWKHFIISGRALLPPLILAAIANTYAPFHCSSRAPRLSQRATKALQQARVSALIKAIVSFLGTVSPKRSPLLAFFLTFWTNLPGKLKIGLYLWKGASPEGDSGSCPYGPAPAPLALRLSRDVLSESTAAFSFSSLFRHSFSDSTSASPLISVLTRSRTLRFSEPIVW